MSIKEGNKRASAKTPEGNIPKVSLSSKSDILLETALVREFARLKTLCRKPAPVVMLRHSNKALRSGLEQ